MVNFAVIVVAVVSAALARPADDKPGGCSSKQDNFLDCFMESGNHIFKMLPTGDKKMGLPVLDPLQVKRMTILNNGDHMHLEMMDAAHSGLGQAVIHNVQADPEHYKFKVNMTIPEYNIKGTYDMNAKLAMMPLQGKGDADFTLMDVTMIWDVKGKPVVRKGKQYMEITDFKVNFEPHDAKVHLDNMFNGNKELGDTMNGFLNENWEEVMKQLKPSMEKAFSQLMKTIGAKLLERVPYKEMFPDM